VACSGVGQNCSCAVAFRMRCTRGPHNHAWNSSPPSSACRPPANRNQVLPLPTKRPNNPNSGVQIRGSYLHHLIPLDVIGRILSFAKHPKQLVKVNNEWNDIHAPGRHVIHLLHSYWPELGGRVLVSLCVNKRGVN